MKTKSKDSGKLRIGDDWNAIRIIALSQSNPLKAIAEFVENCIDAHAKTIAITRGRALVAHYLMVKDDGDVLQVALPVMIAGGAVAIVFYHKIFLSVLESSLDRTHL